MFSANDLVDNAALFGREAAEMALVHGLATKDWRFVAVFAATSLEQLAKAALAERNILLLAETTEQSVLALARGAGTQGRPRTIGAAKAIQRYGAFNRQFASLQPELQDLLNVRNGVVHLAAEAPPDFEAHFNSFLRAVELLAAELDLDEEAFWGSELLPLVEGRRSDRAKTIETTVEERIARAVATFEAKYRGLSEGERAGAIAAVEQTQPAPFFDTSFDVDCPACTRKGWVTVDVEVDWDVSDGEAVPYAYLTPVHFSCGVCHLVLAGDEVEWALPDLELPDSFDPREFSEPPDPEDVPGYRLTDVHPYPPPH